LIGNKVGRVAFLLAQPAIPEVLDALLVSGRPNDPQGMEINSSLDDIGGSSFFAVLEY
jgi:hypothetical protein